MRNKTISFVGKEIRVEEKKIGELEKTVAALFPESEGNIQKIDLEKVIEKAGFDLLYEELPKLFPGVTRNDVENAYISEVEGLIEAFVDVNFTGIRKLLKPLISLVQVGNQPGLPQR